MRKIWIVVILVSACSPRAANMAVDGPVCTDCRSARVYKGAIALNSITYAHALRKNLVDSGIDDEKLRIALSKSLDAAGLLVSDQASRQYFLNVQILAVRRPESGLTITAFVVIRYQLYRSSNRRLVHEDIVESEETRGFSDSIIVLNRSRLSLESAVRENIHDFLSNLLNK